MQARELAVSQEDGWVTSRFALTTLSLGNRTSTNPEREPGGVPGTSMESVRRTTCVSVIRDATLWARALTGMALQGYTPSAFPQRIPSRM
jgi:hypothetical protein